MALIWNQKGNNMKRAIYFVVGKSINAAGLVAGLEGQDQDFPFEEISDVQMDRELAVASVASGVDVGQDDHMIELQIDSPVSDPDDLLDAVTLWLFEDDEKPDCEFVQ